MIEFEAIGNHPNGIIILLVVDGKVHKIVLNYVQAFNLAIKLMQLLKNII